MLERLWQLVNEMPAVPFYGDKVYEEGWFDGYERCQQALEAILRERQ